MNRMKYLRNKPIHKFIKDEFLKLMIGEQEKLVEIRISQEYVDSLKEMVDEWIGYFSEVKNIDCNFISYNNPILS